jgi:hypothetical protein
MQPDHAHNECISAAESACAGNAAESAHRKQCG